MKKPLSRISRLLLPLLLALPFTSSHAALSHDSRLEWKSLRSEHFTVHFHDGEQALAENAIAIAERVHERLAPLFRWTPEEPTEIVLSDQIDLFNGNTTMFPANRMVLYVSTPDSINGLEDHASAMETLILHEYTHIMQLDKASGAPQGMRTLLGRFPLLFPGALQPSWFLEGLATYQETDTQRAIGRGQGSYFDMLMRSEQSCGLKPLRQINQPIASWPSGHVPYLYGVNYYQFIAQRHGAEKIQTLVDNYSDNLLPFSINTTSRQVFGQELDGLWPGFESYLHDKHQPRLAQIQAAGVVAGEQLSHHGYTSGAPLALADGSVIYLRSDGASEPALMRLRPNATEPELIAKVKPASRFDYHPQAGIIIAMPDLHRNANLYYDLYQIDSNSGEQRRLTSGSGGRYRYAAWSPDGKQLIAVHNALAENALHLLDANGKLIAELWRGDSGVTLSTPDWSPDGSSLVLSVWRPDGGWNLERFDLQQRSFKQLTQQSVIEAQPQFTPDGRAVLFSADYDGIYNLQRLDLESGAITTLTRVEGGAFTPTQATSDGPIYYSGYGCGGFDIYRLDQPQPLATASAPAGPSGIPLPAAPLPAGLTQSGYAPYDGLRPRWWFPHLAIESGRVELGAMTAASDALNRHIYVVDAAYDFSNDLVVGAFDYIYDRYYPVFKLHGERLNLGEYDGGDNLLRLRQSNLYMAEVVLPYLSYDRRISLHAAAIAERESDAWLGASVTPRPVLHDNLVGLAAVYDSTRRYPLSISRANGVHLQFVAEDSNALSGSDYSGATYTFDGRAFAALGNQHVFALRLAAGYGEESPRPFRLGGSGSDAATPYPLDYASLGSPFNKRSYALRGYSSGQAALSGTRMALASLEWRFPLKLIERGIMTPPIAIHQIHGSAFIDSGDAWQTGQPRHYATGAGVELHAEVTAFYGLLFDKLDIRSGYAHGFDAGGGDQVYVQIGAGF